ncbi:MAG: TIGR00304 family membrane protein [Thermoprotei archaeon]|jgi:uncharacterized membrane protein
MVNIQTKIMIAGITLIIIGFIIIFIGGILLSIPSEGSTSGSFVILIGPIPIIGSFGPQGTMLTSLNIILILAIIIIIIVYEIIAYKYLRKQSTS